MAAPTRGVMFGSRICCLCASSSYLITKTAPRSTRQVTCRRLASAASLSADIQLDPVVEQQLREGRLKHRQHPGVLTVKSVALPQRLEDAIKVLIDKYPTLKLVQNAEKFSRYLKCRLPPMEQIELRQMGVRIEEEIRSKEVGTRDVAEMSDEELRKLESKVKGKALKQLREQVYHWEAIEYTAYKGFLYMVGRMDHDYAVLIRCLNEVKTRDPSFSPSSVFDFGSGVGSVVWAVNALWGSSVSQLYCVDKTGEMNTLARLLLQDGEEDKTASIPGVYFRQFHPSTQNQFDMTVSAFTLFEFPTKGERLQAVEKLWEMTNDLMVLIENGSHAGYKLIQEARQHILQLGGPSEGHVFSPCPHDQVCPKLSWSKKSSCTTEVKYRKLQLASNTHAHEKAGFSYVILRKGQRNTEMLGHDWPRMVKLSSKPQRHTPCTVCCHDGLVHSLVFTAAKHSKDLYKCSRYCNMGDLLPVRFPDQQDGGLTDGIHGNQTEMADSDGTLDVTLGSEDNSTEDLPSHPTDTSFA